MTKRKLEASWRVAGVGVFCVAAALAAVNFPAGIPPNADYFLPRRAGFGVYRAFWALASARWGPTVFSGAALAVLVVGAIACARALREQIRSWPKTWGGRAGIMFGPFFAATMASRLSVRVFAQARAVWFPYGSMDIREPFATGVFLAAAFALAMAAARLWVAGRRRAATGFLMGMIGVDFLAGLWGTALGIGRPLEIAAESGRTIFIAMTQTAKGPDHEIYALPPNIFGVEDARPYLRIIASRPHDARSRDALRALYAQETKRWNLPGLLEALILGLSRGDPLAPSILLAHLATATPSAAGVAALAALSDETIWRIGPAGAAELSRAYAHIGDFESARRWAARSEGRAGLAAALLDAESTKLVRGRINGVLEVDKKARVALYSRLDPLAPYYLDSSALVAASDVDARGRFSFDRLPMGRYFLVVALSGGDGRRGELSIVGNRGDLLVDAHRPVLRIAPVEIRFLR